MQTTTQTHGDTAPAKTAPKTRKRALRSSLVIGLGILLVAQLLAAFLLGSGGKDLGPAQSAGPLLAFDPEQVTGIRIQAPAGEPVRIAKTEDGWNIPALENLPAARHKVTDLLDKLDGLRKGLPIATSEAALERFKVADQSFERKLILERGDNLPVVLYLGDSPGYRRLFVRAEDDQAIYEAELGLFDAPNQPDAWSDRTLLHLDPEQTQRLTFEKLTLERTDDGWRLTDLAEGEEQDQQAIEDRVRVLTNIAFIGVLVGEEEPATDTEAPPIALEITPTEGETIRYRITKLAEGDNYLLQASNRPQDFTLAGYTVGKLTGVDRTQLLKKPEADEETGEDGSMDDPLPVKEPATESTTGDQDANPTAETAPRSEGQTQDAGETPADSEAAASD